jgi:hypothetical protein
LSPIVLGCAVWASGVPRRSKPEFASCVPPRALC